MKIPLEALRKSVKLTQIRHKVLTFSGQEIIINRYRIHSLTYAYRCNSLQGYWNDDGLYIHVYYGREKNKQLSVYKILE